MQREEQTSHETKLERIADKARKERKLVFTSLAHHVTRERIWENLCRIPKHSAPGVDGVRVEEAKESFKGWVDELIRSIHQQGYKPPAVRRVWIPKPGKPEKRPLGVPCVADRALQRSVAQVLTAIYEQDFLPCSFGGRPGRGAHKALATFNEIVAGKKVEWVVEADLKNYFGTLDHDWVNRFLEHRVKDPRMVRLIQRWLKAGVMEDGEIQANEEGTPQGGSISVLLSNLYLHYALDVWFEHVVKPRMRGEAYLVRYLDDFVACFQYRSDAHRFLNVLPKRLGKFGLSLEPSKTKLVEFGRFAGRHAQRRGRKLESLNFLGFTHYCTRNRKGNFMVGRKTEGKRLRRSLAHIKDLVRNLQHWDLKDQAVKINQALQGHYAYYGVAGNLRRLQAVYRCTERCWRKSLNRRDRKGAVNWEAFHRIKASYPLRKPKLYLPYSKMQLSAVW